LYIEHINLAGRLLPGFANERQVRVIDPPQLLYGRGIRIRRKRRNRSPGRQRAHIARIRIDMAEELRDIVQLDSKVVLSRLQIGRSRYQGDRFSSRRNCEGRKSTGAADNFRHRDGVGGS
jgi:hypothetical protein